MVKSDALLNCGEAMTANDPSNVRTEPDVERLRLIEHLERVQGSLQGYGAETMVEQRDCKYHAGINKARDVVEVELAVQRRCLVMDTMNHLSSLSFP